MKTMLCALLMSAAVAGAATNAVPAMEEQERMFMEAVMLQEQGFYAEAETRLKKLAEWQPDQVTIRHMLADVQRELRARQTDPATLLMRKLEAIIVPELVVREAAVGDVIELLQRQSEKLSLDKTAVNFVWQAPEEVKQTRVTLQLQKIPLLDAVRYVADVAKLKFRVDAYAVVIYKPEPPPLPAPPPTEPDVKP
jgi:hypothetical protein